MTTPSGPIRKQLGPAKKRLSTRIAETNHALESNDISLLKSLRPKLNGNVVYLNGLIEKLQDVKTTDNEEQKIIDTELEGCAELQMDACECVDAVSELLDNPTDDDNKMAAMVKLKETEKLERELENLKLDGDVKRAQLKSLTEGATVGDASAVVNKRVKLPRLELPEFDGDILKWTAFWDSFKSTIHLNADIAKVDKFKYLKSCLKGEAKNAAAGFSSTDAQYDELVEHLKDRYDDKPYIISSHYTALTKLKQAKNETKALRWTFNSIETHLRSLNSLGEIVENNYLISQVKSKLPEEMNLKLEELRSEEAWTTTLLRKSINRLITARERSEETHTRETDEHEIPQYSGEGLLTRDVQIKCIFCSAPHWSDECQRYKTVEERKEKIRGRCFVCLSNNHFFRECTVKKPCFHCKRKGNHHSSLCPVKFASPPEDGGEPEAGIASHDVEQPENTDEVMLNVGEEVIMKIAIVKVRNPVTGEEISLIAFMDSGSKRTYILSEKARKLNLKVTSKKPVHVNTFGTKESKQVDVSITEFTLICKDGSGMAIKNAKVVETITGPMVRQEINVGKYHHTCKNLNMVKTPGKRFTIDILIGNDYYEDIMTSEKIQVDKGLYLLNSVVGWMFSGRIAQRGNPSSEQVELVMLNKEKDELKKFWELESIGIDSTTEKDEEHRAMMQFNEKVKFVNDRYQVPWLWKLCKYELQSNFSLCEKRLKSFYSTKNGTDIELYDAIIQKQLESGHIEVADSSREYKDRSDVVLHYLPHHMVKSAEKLRIVYEGCAKSHPSQKSLNDCLYPGKNMVANLCGMLLRFRLPTVAILADIEKAYLQLDLSQSDRDATRFLWLKDIKKPPSKQNIQEFRFTRVIWGIICSAFLLAATIIHHLKKFDTPIAQQIERDLYIDNLATGVSSVAEAIDFYRSTKKIFNSASMNMREWLSNSEEVMSEIDAKDRNTKLVEKVLGMLWHIQGDTLCYPWMKELKIVDKLCKRLMLKCTHGIFDPPGFVAPAVLKPKVLIQKCWKKKLGWDETVPPEIKEEWDEWISEMVALKDVKIKRCINIPGNGETEYELIIFTDASKFAYAVAVYLRVSKGDTIDCNLIFSKTRLSPTKELTIPRLELLGVLIGCRISKFVVRELGLQLSQLLLFTDSICVIEWYKSERKLKRFVQDKIEEIRTFEGRIGYVKSADNPADIASRGMCLSKLLEEKLWWKGPEWLGSMVLPEQTYHVDQATMEAIAKEVVLHEVGLINEAAVILQSPFGINLESYSSFHRLIRVTSWCLRFINNYMKSEKREPVSGCLQTCEIQKSVLLWDRFIQKQSFPTIFSAIVNKKKHPLRNLGIVENADGVLECKGRFQNSQRNAPKLLPKEHVYSKLVIDRSHKRVLHYGVAQTLSELRKEYWVLQGRSAVRKLVLECLTCIKWEGAPFQTPDFAPLPDFVVSTDDKVSFSYVGIDYFGFMLVKEGDVTSKVWGCLFTCLKVRAVHLELVESMSSESFLLALERFVSRRGKPKMIISDNASQVILGQEVMDRIWFSMLKDEIVQSYVAQERIEWKWITEYSPWKGGFYERMVGIAKRACKKALGKCAVSKEQMRTLLIKVEAVMNTRPLVYVGDDINSGEALTPAHFLGTNCKLGLPDAENEGYSPSELSSDHLIESWRRGQTHLNNFWKIWSNEYLQSLREAHTTNLKPIKGQVNRIPSVGEVVILKEELLPRGRWKLGRIEELIHSSVDGVQRAAVVKISSGKKLKRPYRLIYPLERSANLGCSSSKGETELAENKTENSTGNSSRRSARAAAEAARLKIATNLRATETDTDDGD